MGECTYIHSFEELQSALAGSTPVIRLAAGTYPVDTTLSIPRNVTIVAAEGAVVVLDGQGTRRVMTIIAGTVQLIELSITNGHAPDVFAVGTLCFGPSKRLQRDG